MSDNSNGNSNQSKASASSDRMQHFRKQVYYWVKQIPYGKVSSYGRIAKLAGFPRHARHVSKALGLAHSDLKLPWHRVIGSDGQIAFNADNPYYAEQRQRLKKEGVRFIKGKVDAGFFWSPHSSAAGDISAEEFFR
ncbi:DNA-binding protein [Kangiella profundi]|uniref:DNA-binding protein n=1 Tax=Kangiella profundi TaxID=1561924 RepID=A0A2K9ANY0_9GAMM|nr:methylated-DNA--[protein]-cysteine S-methyltransferase [Kangiella profundi]AUD78123.1 DNA-binding protein [Kangiella profundi]